MRRLATPVWAVMAAAAVLWPSRFTGPLDGAPLDSAADALVIGLALPALWWLSRDRFRSQWSRAAIVTLLIWKAGTGAVAVQQGLCMQAVSAQPLAGTAMTMRIDEREGFLRSWDLRSDLWSATPQCTAVVTRPLTSLASFPTWFLNITDQMIRRDDINLRFSGFVTTAAGTRAFEESMPIVQEGLRFTPQIDGESLYTAATVTTREPRGLDLLLASWAWLVAPLLVIALTVPLAIDAFVRLRMTSLAWGWVLVASLVAAMLGLSEGIWQRAAGAIAFGALLVPVASPMRNVRGAFVLIGVPWLVFFAVASASQIGHFSIYSTDDWLAYQVAGYRIFINGFWLEAGSPTFDYQPLYRWVSGALHLVFGDSSVGEVYWDASLLLIGALLAFQIVRATAGFRWGITAAAASLATFTIGTPWYFLGRGLAEITAAGFAFLAMWFMLRARLGSLRWIGAATAMAVLMFLARLNHLLWVAFIPAMLLPLAAPANWRAIVNAIRGVRIASAATYASAFVAALLLFMTRTWYYTGDFSLFYGTSLRHNDTGLRPWTLLDATAWSKVWHSVQSFAWMNEPPSPDPRAIVMIAGCVLGAMALLQVPAARRLPAALVITAAGSMIGALFAHAHGYPGRFSIHAVPLASAVTAITAAKVSGR